MKDVKARLPASFDGACGHILIAEGFCRSEAGAYERTAAEGTDRLIVDPRPRDRYCIMVGFFPIDLEFLDSLGRHGEPKGFGVGPYLGQQSISSREYLWPARSLEDGAARPCRAVAEVALPWLRRLRDKAFFASQVDQRAALFSAAAYERAGMMEAARANYLIMLGRVRSALAACKTERTFASAAGRTYILIARKLGVDLDIADRLEAILGAKVMVQSLSDKGTEVTKAPS